MSAPVAVVVTCLDSGRAVADAVASVRRQSRPVDELLVMDAGSGDLLTRQLLEALEREGTRVARSEGSAGAVRNAGISQTSAAYLVVLAADDQLDPTMVEKAAALLDRDDKLDVVACGARWIADARVAWAPPACSVAATLAHGGIPAARMFRRGIWEGTGGFEEGHELFVEADFFASVFARGMRGTVLPEPLLLVGTGEGTERERSLRRDRHRSLMAGLHGRRRELVETHAADILVAKEELVEAQRQRRDALKGKRQAAREEIERLEGQVALLVAELAGRGETRIDAGDLRREDPLLSRETRDAAASIERHYADAFYARHRDAISGRVLEAGSSRHLDALAGESVTRREVLVAAPALAEGTLVAEIDALDGIPAGSFDGILLPDALAAASDLRAAIAHAERILAPGGALLATLPAAPERPPEDARGRPSRWRPTELGLRELLAEAFPIGSFSVESWGNVWSATAAAHGLRSPLLTPAELDRHDPDHPVGFGIRATKPASAAVVKRDTTVGAILVFHRIASADADPRGIGITPGSFRSQMEYLSEHYRPLPLGDLIDAKDKGDIPPRSIAVTFDDGYADALLVASPILMALGIPATFFVGSGSLDGKREAWWDLLERVLLGTESLPPRLEVALGGTRAEHATGTAEERRAAHQALQAQLGVLPVLARQEAIEAIVAWSGQPLAPRDTHRLLAGSEIAELVRRGFAIGGQTSHHAHLPSESADAIRREIEADRSALERCTGSTPTAFCYPHGAFTPRVVAAVRDAGYEAAVTEREGMVWPASSSLLLPRIEVKAKNRGTFVELLRRIHEI